MFIRLDYLAIFTKDKFKTLHCVDVDDDDDEVIVVIKELHFWLLLCKKINNTWATQTKHLYKHAF